MRYFNPPLFFGTDRREKALTDFYLPELLNII